jgi:hypothetical protein
MVKRFTLRTFVISVFHGWRRAIIEAKVKRRTLMSKAWKSLKVQVTTAKHQGK